MRKDIHQDITNRIIAELENGVRPWLKPWSADHLAGRVTRPLRHNGIPYRGINTILLWAVAAAAGYAAPTWMTFRQAHELGGQVRKGETGQLVVYAGTLTREAADATDEEASEEIHFLKGYTVFNVSQIDGLPNTFYAAPALTMTGPARIAHADAFFAATGATIREGGNRAFYAQGSDHIQMPPLACFRDAESYYATLAHEATHWTMPPARLARDFGRKRWGDDGYAMEELVAELGAAFLWADLALTPELRPDHAAYLANWLTVLKRDNRAIFAAAAHAQRAVEFLHRFSNPTAAAA